MFRYMKYARIGVGILTAAAAGAAVYALVNEKKRRERLVMPGVKRSKVVMFPSERPPYAEAAETGQ